MQVVKLRKCGQLDDSYITNILEALHLHETMMMSPD